MYIIVDVLQSATANIVEKGANKVLPGTNEQTQKCQMVRQWNLPRPSFYVNLDKREQIFIYNPTKTLSELLNARAIERK